MVTFNNLKLSFRFWGGGDRLLKAFGGGGPKNPPWIRQWGKNILKWRRKKIFFWVCWYCNWKSSPGLILSRNLNLSARLSSGLSHHSPGLNLSPIHHQPRPSPPAHWRKYGPTYWGGGGMMRNPSLTISGKTYRKHVRIAAEISSDNVYRTCGGHLIFCSGQNWGNQW